VILKHAGRLTPESERSSGPGAVQPSGSLLSEAEHARKSSTHLVTDINAHLELEGGLSMHSKLVCRILMISMIVCSLLAVTVSAMAQSDKAESHEGHCSNRTLSGEYGCSVQGVLLNVPGLPPEATFVGVTTSTFDGKGNLTGTEHVVVNGMSFNPGFDTNSGTYSVNPDCTGTALVNTPNSPVSLKLYFAIVDDGKEFRQVLNTDALVTVCKRVR
jgi:hypothetical protein